MSAVTNVSIRVVMSRGVEIISSYEHFVASEYVLNCVFFSVAPLLLRKVRASVSQRFRRGDRSIIDILHSHAYPIITINVCVIRDRVNARL